MRNHLKPAVLASVALALLIGPGAALAAKPDHVTLGGTASEDDFCGTGMTIDLAYDGVINLSPGKARGHAETTYTNPLNGASVTSVTSGNQTFTVVDDGDGAYTLVFTYRGNPLKVSGANGRPLIHDVGQLIEYDHFDADNNFIGSDVVMHGPHPSYQDPNLFCDVMIEALGL